MNTFSTHKKNVILYCRSMDANKQKEQLEMLVNHCQENGYNVVLQVLEACGGGRECVSPLLKQTQTFMDKNKDKNLLFLVVRFDRIARDLELFSNFLLNLRELGIEVQSVENKIDDCFWNLLRILKY